jgi:predicted RNA-binding Zn-ribbon protein involved in translation (DUF1610 family)
MYDPPTEPDDDFEIPRCVCCANELNGADYGWQACGRCQDRMTDRLNQVEHDYLELPRHLQRGAAVNSGVRSGGSVVAALPVRLDVLSMLGPGGIVTELCAVEDDWRRARGFTVQAWRGNADQVLPKVCKFLRNSLPWACSSYEDVADLDQILARIAGQLRGVVTGEHHRTIRVACMAEWDDGTVCGAEMRVGAHTIRQNCPGCGAEWTRETFLRLAAEANQFGAAA